MGGLKDIAGDKVHTRDIAVTTYAAGEDSIILEGILVDRRLKDYFLFTGEQKSAGVLHHMVIRLLLKGPHLKILEVEVEMPEVPREECRELAACLETIVGLTITPGFTAKIKERVGGLQGCFHLLTLLLAMAPAGIQGYWSNRMTRPLEKNAISKQDRIKFLPINSCGVWRADGPLVQRIKKELEID